MNNIKEPILVILQGGRFTGRISPLSPRRLNKSRFCSKPSKEGQNTLLNFSTHLQVVNWNVMYFKIFRPLFFLFFFTFNPLKESFFRFLFGLFRWRRFLVTLITWRGLLAWLDQKLLISRPVIRLYPSTFGRFWLWSTLSMKTRAIGISFWFLLTISIQSHSFKPWDLSSWSQGRREGARICNWVIVMQF